MIPRWLPSRASDLVAFDAAHLFGTHTTWIGFRRSALLRAHMYDFIELLAPHLPRELVRETEQSGTQEDVDRICADLHIPLPDRTGGLVRYHLGLPQVPDQYFGALLYSF
jgi:hypothetical protein